jgi:transposase
MGASAIPIQFTATSGEIRDSRAANELVEPLPPAKAVVADKGHNSEKIHEQIKNKGADAMIPGGSN